MAGMRRSEVSALRWADVADAADRDGVLVTVRRGKTNQEGERRDVRFVKDGVARALRTLRAAAGPVPEDQVVPLSPQMVGLRFAAAARPEWAVTRASTPAAQVRIWRTNGKGPGLAAQSGFPDRCEQSLETARAVCSASR